MSVISQETISAMESRVRWLKQEIVAQEQLSEPCPPGRWRWADSGKSQIALAEDRAVAIRKTLALKTRLADIETDLGVFKAFVRLAEMRGE